jgi:hypothetical protein
MKLQTNVMSYGGNGKTIRVPSSQSPRMATLELEKERHSTAQAKNMVNGEPDFSKMTPAQKAAYHKARWDRILG